MFSAPGLMQIARESRVIACSPSSLLKNAWTGVYACSFILWRNDAMPSTILGYSGDAVHAWGA